MLVDRAGVTDGSLVGAIGGCKESRLAEEPFGASIVVGAIDQRVSDQSFERLHRAMTSAEFVIKTEHLHKQPGSKLERGRGAARLHLARGAAQERLALEFRQQARFASDPLVKLLVELGTSHDHRNHDCGAWTRETLVFQCAAQLRRGRAGRDDDRAGAQIGEVRRDERRFENGALKGAEPGGPHHTGTSRSNYGRDGGFSQRIKSCRARSSSISAPAAADDALHASCSLPLEIAESRCLHAEDASCTALTKSACTGARSAGGVTRENASAASSASSCARRRAPRGGPASSRMSSTAPRNDVSSWSPSAMFREYALYSGRRSSQRSRASRSFRAASNRTSSVAR